MAAVRVLPLRVSDSRCIIGPRGDGDLTSNGAGLGRVVGQGLVQEMAPGAVSALPLARKPNVVEAFAPTEPL
ncbi:hypothetical protein Aco04nite_91390 [Winogradskya consettensis]|uniref:Uncharacterized protein n=1 Tax=Winogradskya consettensis TaxID=113560 RepID=A0A919T472_9ACTN|nr:hypothetical protein Aco04nite_91390 [Actinoplanes consettensis]